MGFGPIDRDMAHDRLSGWKLPDPSGAELTPRLSAAASA
jgi:hypothetical protein